MADRPLTVITGASSGIGEALARLVHADGYGLVLVARRGERLRTLAASLGEDVAVCEADLASDEGCEALIAFLAGLSRSVDVLINNAGIGASGAFANSEPQRNLAIVDLNVRAVVALSNALLPQMVARRRGGILNVASLAAFQPGPNTSVYYASKAFVLSFSQALSAEVRSAGVTVSALCPGPVETEFFAEAGMDKVRLRKVGKALTAERVARDGWRGFRAGRRVIVPGLAGKAAAVLATHTPRRIVLPIVKLLQSEPR